MGCRMNVVLCDKSLQSCPTICDPVDLACQAPLSVGFCRQEHWSGLPGPPPGDLPDPGIEHGLPALQVDSLLSVTVEAQIWCWAPIKVSSISYHLPAAGLARLSVVVVVFSTPGTVACQASLSSTTSQNCSSSRPLSG